MLSYEFQGLCVYWSEVASPEALLEGQSCKAAVQRYRQVLREIVTGATPISFPYPAVAANLEEVEKLLAERLANYTDALSRIVGNVQYELTATWSESAGKDLATPVSGQEYLKRHSESEARVAAIDAKLRSVTAGIVLDWRTRRERRNYLWYALLPREARGQFIEALRKAGPSEGVRLRLRGPWPPDAFAYVHAGE